MVGIYLVVVFTWKIWPKVKTCKYPVYLLPLGKRFLRAML